MTGIEDLETKLRAAASQIESLKTALSEAQEAQYPKYFVLKPAGDDIYAQASREAMKAYAKTIEDDDNALWFSMMGWVRQEEHAYHARRIDGDTE